MQLLLNNLLLNISELNNVLVNVTIGNYYMDFEIGEVNEKFK